jgi:hypothetical protein
MIDMSFCPKCKTEYPDGRLACSVCGKKLVPNLSAEPDSIGDEALLVSVNEGFPAEMIEGSLRSAGIPFIKKGHCGPVGFARYDSKYDSLGADFYVPSKLLKRAKELLPPLDGVIYDDISDSDEDSGELPDSNQIPDEEPSESGGAKRIAVTIGFLVLIVLVIFGVDYVMNLIRAMLGYQ